MAYVHQEYPKAANTMRKDRWGKDIPVPLKYRAGHLRHGEFVVFQNAREEDAFNIADAEPASLAPEMHSHAPTTYNRHWQSEQHSQPVPDYNFHWALDK
jgi:hypothetical protein